MKKKRPDSFFFLIFFAILSQFLSCTSAIHYRNVSVVPTVRRSKNTISDRSAMLQIFVVLHKIAQRTFLFFFFFWLCPQSLPLYTRAPQPATFKRPTDALWKTEPVHHLNVVYNNIICYNRTIHAVCSFGKAERIHRLSVHMHDAVHRRNMSAIPTVRRPSPTVGATDIFL
jgi:hypothetical protein